MNPVLLIDADYLVFMAGFATEPMVYNVSTNFGEEQFRYKKEAREFVSGLDEDDYEITSERKLEPVENALHLVKQKLEYLLSQVKHSSYETFLTATDKSNFRYEVATIQPYKGNRKGVPRPTHEKAIREYLIDRWGATVSEGQEADDDVSISAHYYSPNYVIASEDKDLETVPGWHTKLSNIELYKITPTQARVNFYTQMLTGDTADHIRGVPGIGIKGAEKIIGETTADHKLFAKVREAYYNYHTKQLEKQELSIEEETIWNNVDREILETGRLLWMKTSPGEMWEPPPYSGPLASGNPKQKD